MITQKAISVKMDAVTLEELDRECYYNGKKRNRVINDAVEHYMKYLDKVREDGYWKNMVPEASDERCLKLGKYILDNLTDEELEHISFSAKGFGCEEEYLIYRFVVGALVDFSKRPFSYL